MLNKRAAQLGTLTKGEPVAAEAVIANALQILQGFRSVCNDHSAGYQYLKLVLVALPRLRVTLDHWCITLGMCESLQLEIDASARPSMCGVTRAFTLLFEELMVSQKTVTLFASSSLSCAHKKAPGLSTWGFFICIWCPDGPITGCIT